MWGMLLKILLMLTTDHFHGPEVIFDFTVVVLCGELVSVHVVVVWFLARLVIDVVLK